MKRPHCLSPHATDAGFPTTDWTLITVSVRQRFIYLIYVCVCVCVLEVMRNTLVLWYNWIT